MAKSKLGVVENGVEQTVVEPEAGISNQSAPEIRLCRKAAKPLPLN